MIWIDFRSRNVPYENTGYDSRSDIFNQVYTLSSYLSLFKSNLNLVQFVELENILFIYA